MIRRRGRRKETRGWTSVSCTESSCSRSKASVFFIQPNLVAGINRDLDVHQCHKRHKNFMVQKHRLGCRSFVCPASKIF